MDKKTYLELLTTINEARGTHVGYDDNMAPNYSKKDPLGMDDPQIADYLTRKGVLDQTATDKPNRSGTESEEKKKLTGPKGGNVYNHIDSNAFGLDDAAHAKAKELVSSLKNAYTAARPGAIQAIHDHLADSGVDTNDPHMKSLLASADEEEQMNYDKSRSRAGL